VRCRLEDVARAVGGGGQRVGEDEVPGEVGSDVTALEDPTAVDKLKALVKAPG